MGVYTDFSHLPGPKQVGGTIKGLKRSQLKLKTQNIIPRKAKYEPKRLPFTALYLIKRDQAHKRVKIDCEEI
jgi:hypothetical protein